MLTIADGYFLGLLIDSRNCYFIFIFFHIYVRIKHCVLISSCLLDEVLEFEDVTDYDFVHERDEQIRALDFHFDYLMLEM